MSKNSVVGKLPLDVQKWITQSLVDGSYENYDALQERLLEKGYDISRSALARFGKKLLGKYEILKLAKIVSPEEETARREELRMRCVEVAKGDIERAEQLFTWVRSAH